MLTIGMATHREPEDVWWTLEVLHAMHPRVQYLVIDNSPERNRRTEDVCRAVGGRYFHRPDLLGTSRPRDAVFRFSDTPWTCCIDAHVFLEAGGVQALLDYAKANPNSNDLIQGPLINDAGGVSGTHWRPATTVGQWGEWDRDPRGLNPDDAPFEIPMMGLGLFAMRTKAWPGFNRLFRGFGGEEGYLHEKVRQRGAKTICHPAIRWRHKFRDSITTAPYPLSLTDHVRNLLIGHKELGIDADTQIFDHFGKRLGSIATWEALKDEVAAIDVKAEIPRQHILGVYYTDNSAPETVVNESARSVMRANEQTIRHDVTISACTWKPVNANIPQVVYRGEKRRGYDTILGQIRQAVTEGLGGGYDAICFLEHDVLYPPDYFDRVGDALAANPNSPVISNLDYIGLNSTGWQAVRERHEPLHQLTLRWDTFLSNLARAEVEAKTGRPVILEPDHDGDRSDWARLPPVEMMPSVHINHDAGRFTGHGDVCYDPVSYSRWHPHWGSAERYWPGPMAVSLPQTSPGCSSCTASESVSLEDWYKKAESSPSDFHEHMKTIRELAANCDSATELSRWMKPADVAMAVAVKGSFTSYCPLPKPQWPTLAKQMGDKFKGIPADAHVIAGIEPTDLLFIDTDHTAIALMPMLERDWKKVRKYIAVHCTEIYGEKGDQADTPGVLHALRTFCQLHPEWVVKSNDRNNYGMIVLSRCQEDVKELPGLFRKAMNYASAMARHAANGRKTVSLEVLEERQSHCALCPERAMDACSPCGCPLESKLPLASEECGLAKRPGGVPKWGPV